MEINGNIAAMLVNVPKLGEPVIYSYGYDQLNRLVSTDAYHGLNTANANWTPISTSDYRERFAYNPDGGITNLQRNGANGTVIDNATWNYYPGTHQLEHIADPAGRHGFDAGQQNTNNYQWDGIGEMTSDNERGLTNMDWTVYGKIWHQTMNGTSISYTYDPSGKRLSKTVGGTNGYSEYYVHDASGNTMAIYKSQNNTLKVSELGLYGSSKLGGWQTGTDVTSPTGIPANGSDRVFTRGQQYFILSDHRGNTYLTVSDRVIPVSKDGLTVDHNTADVITAQDYSSFGSLLDGRQFGGAPRYTYNGKQLDGETGWQDYGMREYLNGEVPVFPTPDPLTESYPSLTPYQFGSNNPIQNIDLDGAEGTGSNGAGTVTVPEIAPEQLPEQATRPTSTLQSGGGPGRTSVGPNGLSTRPGNNLGTLPSSFGTTDAQTKFMSWDEIRNLVPPNCTGFQISQDGTYAIISGPNGTWTRSLLKKPVPVLSAAQQYQNSIVTFQSDTRLLGANVITSAVEFKKEQPGVEYFYRAMSLTEFGKTGGLIQARGDDRKDYPFITPNLAFLTNAKSFIWNNSNYELIVRYTVTSGTNSYLFNSSQPHPGQFGSLQSVPLLSYKPVKKEEKFTIFGGAKMMNINFGFPGQTGSGFFNPNILKIEVIPIFANGLKDK